MKKGAILFDNEISGREYRLFCQVLPWTGVWLTKALALNCDWINFDRCSTTLLTIKKNKLTG